MNMYRACLRIKSISIMHQANRTHRIEKLPQAELVADKGYEILYFTEDIDEFAD